MNFWTYHHLITYVPSLAFMMVIAAILRKVLLNKDKKIRLIPFQFLAVSLFTLEVVKQIISLTRGYDLYHLPFHFCSMFIFFIPLSAFYRGKWEKPAFSFTTFICSVLFMFMLICPNTVYADTSIENMFTDFLFFHQVIFHNIAVFEFILIVSLKLYEPNTKFDLKIAAIALPCYCLIGSVMAQVLKTNYNNFYYCTADFIDNVRLDIIDTIGYAAGQTVYVIGVSAVILFFALISYFVYRLIYKVVNTKFANTKKESEQCE